MNVDQKILYSLENNGKFSKYIKDNKDNFKIHKETFIKNK